MIIQKHFLVRREPGIHKRFDISVFLVKLWETLQVPTKIYLVNLQVDSLELVNIYRRETQWFVFRLNSVKSTLKILRIFDWDNEHTTCLEWTTYFSLKIIVLTNCTLSLDSCRHVVAILSARGEEAWFRMRVIMGVILIRSLVYTKHIPGRLRSGSGVALE